MILFLCYNKIKKDKNMTTKILILLFMLLFTGCFSNEKSSDEKRLEKPSSDLNHTQKQEAKVEKIETKKAESTKVESSTQPLFSLTTIKGKKINISELSGGLSIHEFKDKVVFFIFFGHRCPPCIAEIPALIELTKEGHKDLEIIGLEVQELDDTSLTNFAKNKAINYHLISSEKNQEFISYIASKAGWTGAIPFLLAMDTKGVVQIVHAGGLGKAQFDNMYNELKTKKK